MFLISDAGVSLPGEGPREPYPDSAAASVSYFRLINAIRLTQVHARKRAIWSFEDLLRSPRVNQVSATFRSPSAAIQSNFDQFKFDGVDGNTSSYRTLPD